MAREISEVEDVVTSVTLLLKARGGTPMWHQVKLEERTEVFVLHNNWFYFCGNLKAGDHVRYVESKCQLGKDGTQGEGQKGWLLFDKLQTIEAKPELEEAEPVIE